MAKIIVDSGCDLTQDIINKVNIDIELVPLSLQIDNEHFIDDLSVDLDKYIEKMKNSPNPVKSANPSPHTFIDAFKNEQCIFIITLASTLSGTYNSACIAKNMYLEENKDAFVHVFDSRGASCSETLIILKINELLEKNLPNEEIVKQVEEFIQRQKIYFIFESYDNLVKNGRMKESIAKIANMLSIKPILYAHDGIGEIELYKKCRGFNNALNKLIDIACNTTNFEEKTLLITHVNNKEKAEYIKESVQQRVNFKDIIILDPTALVVTYANDKGIVISFED